MNNAFLNLTSYDSIKKMNIDPRIVQSFKRVMQKLQTFFDANKYSNIRDYDKIFKNSLLNDDENKKFGIYVNNEPSSIGNGIKGFYDNDEKKICIDVSVLNEDSDVLDHCLCHELIHFLVLYDLEIKDTNDIWQSLFINEALTEMLTRQIYPTKEEFYIPQISMLTFANELSQKVNNYSSFLRGGIDSKQSSSSWGKFLNYTSKYQAKPENLFMDFAVKDDDYINAQREIIATYIKPHKINSLDKYNLVMRQLKIRPVKDEEYINNLISQINRDFVDNICTLDKNLKDYLLKQIEQYYFLLQELDKYDTEVFEFKLDDKVIALDKNGNCYGDIIGVTRSFSPEDGKLTFSFKDNKKTFYLKDIDFSERKRNIKEQLLELSEYFSGCLRNDYLKIKSLAKSEKPIIKLERYTLPNISGKDNSTIYVAIYENGIEVLNSVLLDTKKDFKRSNYIGSTSDQNGLILYEPLTDGSNGYVFSSMSINKIKFEICKKIREMFYENIQQNELEHYIDEYRKSDSYNPDFEDTIEEDVKNWLARRKYENLSEDERRQYELEVTTTSPNVIVSKENGDICVSMIHGENSFVCKKTVLVDKNKKSLYNFLYDDLVLRYKQENENSNSNSNDLQDESFYELMRHIKNNQNEDDFTRIFEKKYKNNEDKIEPKNDESQDSSEKEVIDSEFDVMDFMKRYMTDEMIREQELIQNEQIEQVEGNGRLM